MKGIEEGKIERLEGVGLENVPEATWTAEGQGHEKLRQRIVELLKRAYEQSYTPAFTDDASVVEALGVSVMLTEGNHENIKITTPFDLRVAEALL